VGCQAKLITIIIILLVNCWITHQSTIVNYTNIQLTAAIVWWCGYWIRARRRGHTAAIAGAGCNNGRQLWPIRWRHLWRN